MPMALANIVLQAPQQHRWREQRLCQIVSNGSSMDPRLLSFDELISPRKTVRQCAQMSGNVHYIVAAGRL
ncbi:hypothetical protein LP415_01610 [Polaromonas sp. P1(28)-8]|nr:hypothetical protein LP415_01610 [Polaromonas sp. P1(28)-8]